MNGNLDVQRQPGISHLGCMKPKKAVDMESGDLSVSGLAHTSPIVVCMDFLDQLSYPDPQKLETSYLDTRAR